jgi:hypothetical protein
MDNSIVSPPCIKVAVFAVAPSMVICFFFMAFFKADFVGVLIKIPIP